MTTKRRLTSANPSTGTENRGRDAVNTTVVQHAPLPWNYHDACDQFHIFGKDGGYALASRVYQQDGDGSIAADKKVALANASFIVRACNNHNQLTEALRVVAFEARAKKQSGIASIAEDAIAKAKGG